MTFGRSPQSLKILAESNLGKTMPSSGKLRADKSLLWAGLASVSLHGLAVILLPYIANFSRVSQPQLLSSIKVVELNAKEQSRIPVLNQAVSSPNPLPAIFYEPILPIPPQKISDRAKFNPSPPPAPSPSAKLDNSPDFLPEFTAEIPAKVLNPSPSVNPDNSPPGFTVEFAPNVSTPSPNNYSVAVEASPSASPNLIVSAPGQIFLSPSPVPEAENNSSEPSPQPTDNAADLPLENQAEDNADKLVFNSENTKDDAGNLNYQSWADKLEISNLEFEKIFLKGSYPEIACQKKLTGEVAVAILMDRDRQPNSPEVVKSSGYQVFDEQAITDTMSANFDTAVVGKPYLVMVKYQPKDENCQS